MPTIDGTVLANTTRFFIEELPDRYRLHNVRVPYEGGELWVLDWSKDFLDGGNPHGQDDWVSYTRNIEFKLPSGPQYWATVVALYEHRNSEDAEQKFRVGQVASLFRPNSYRKEDTSRVNQAFRNLPFVNRFMTSTRVTWAAVAPDIVVHGYGYLGAEEIQTDIVGSLGEFSAVPKIALETLLGSSDVKKLTSAGRWLGHGTPHLWLSFHRPMIEVLKVNGLNPSDWVCYNGPPRDVARVLVFDVYDKGGLECNSGCPPNYPTPALGLAVHYVQ